MPTQNVMKTKVGARLLSAFCEPSSPATITSASSATPAAPAATWTGRLAIAVPMAPGSGRQRSASKRGSRQRTASARNDTTSTATDA